jgi:hypothetical protein
MARHFDMSEVPWIRLLFDIRTLPDAMTKKEKAGKKTGLGVDQITSEETGFMILHETPGKEVVIGSVGQFWRLKIPFEKVAPENFKNFRSPGFGKIAWSIAVEPFQEGSTIAIELRTSATDERSWKKLNRYYHIIGVGSKLIRTSVMHHLEAALGKMKVLDDDEKALPGDEMIPGTKYQLTSHRTIEAPSQLVWRYLMQLGCDRAGWYSIDALDNGGKPSVDHLIDGWENRQPGDKVHATPKGDSFFNVQAVEYEKYFILGGDTVRMNGPFRMTWAFVLEHVGEDATRLTSRARMESSPKWMEWIMGRIAYPPIHGLMSHAQLDKIKALAERDAQARIEVADAMLA